MWGCIRYTFEVFLTGDGKLLVSNHGEKYWVCGNVGSMAPTDCFFETLCRWGSFLTSVTARHRIGDYNHCA